MKIEGTAAYHANPSPNYGNAFLNGIKMDVGELKTPLYYFQTN